MLQYNEGEYATMWVDTSLIITPTSSEQPTQDTVKEIKSTDAISDSITFEEEAEDKIATSNPKTGDTNNVLVWASLIVTSALTMFGITVYAKKKKSII